MEQTRHLVNKGAGTARASAVHALFNAVIKVDNFCVFSAKLNRYVCLRDKAGNGSLRSNNFLHKLEAQPGREQKAARAGDRDFHVRMLKHLGSLMEESFCGGADISVMALVACIDKLVVRVENSELNRGRTYVNTKAQPGTAPVKAGLGRQLNRGTRLFEREFLGLCTSFIYHIARHHINSRSRRASAALGRELKQAVLRSIIFAAHGTCRSGCHMCARCQRVYKILTYSISFFRTQRVLLLLWQTLAPVKRSCIIRHNYPSFLRL